jgi:hypothetical protein
MNRCLGLTLTLLIGGCSAGADSSREESERAAAISAAIDRVELQSRQTALDAETAPPRAPGLTARPTIQGYPCTDDCSGHEAGYAWAEEQEISDPDDCGGNSLSFIEGCESYAEKAQEQRREEEEDEELSEEVAY